MSSRTLLYAAVLLIGVGDPAAAQERPAETRRASPALEITAVSPQAGPPGTRVELRVQGLRRRGAGETQVSLNGLAVEVVRARRGRLVVQIPDGAQSGPLVVTRGDEQATAPMPFTVAHTPTLVGFSPESGKGGAEVTLTGTHLGPGLEVWLGREAATVVRQQGDRSVVVQVPAKVSRDARWRVRTAAGEARTDERFKIEVWPVVEAVEPLAGEPGSRIRLQGQWLREVEGVRLGEVALSIERRRRGRLEVEIPPGARSGTLAIEAYGRVEPIPFSFEVLDAPAITGVSPAAGWPGAELTIEGGPFSERARVRLGRARLPVVRGSAEALVVVVPRRARGRDYVWVEDGPRKIRSPKQFQVLEPPVVSGFSPKATRPGQDLRIRGRGFGPKAQVYVGPHQAVVLVQSPRELVVQVPPDLTPGSYPVRVSTEEYEDRARGRLRITPGPEIVRVRPTRAPAGAVVSIEGERFDRDARVFWGQVELYVVSRDRRGRRIEVRLPADVTGTDYVFVDDGVTRVRSHMPLEAKASQ
ncbi:IPT/TIG domain-containing protein [Haliangium sp.]|uniref:IPT/TIG domain-containing protein n=1 Tax=Haliangium sp. TaxID=2663208 RepID=UPI003D13265E